MPYGLPDYGVTPYGEDPSEIQRRLRYAEMLRRQSMEPLGERTQMVGRVAAPISWAQGAAKLVQGLSAGMEQRATEQERKAMGERITTKRNQALSNALRAAQGTPGSPQPATELGGGPPQPPQAPNPMQALSGLYATGDPVAIQFGSAIMQLQQHQQDMAARAEDRRLSREERAAARHESEVFRLQIMQMQQQFQQRMQGSQQGFMQSQAEAQRQFQAQQNQLSREAQAANRPAPRPVAVIGENGQPTYVEPGQAVGRTPYTPQQQRPITEGQAKSATYGTRAAMADKTLTELEDKVSTTGLAMKQGAENLPIVGGVLGTVGNLALSGDQQRVEQAQRNFVNAVLRQESGAVIGPSEFESAKKQYFPQPGDGPEVIAQKRANRQAAIQGFKRAAGPGAPDIDAAISTTPKLGGGPAESLLETPRRRATDLFEAADRILHGGG